MSALNILLPEIGRQQKQDKQVVFRSGLRGRPGVAGAGRIAGAKAAVTNAGQTRFELLECKRMGRCSQKCPSDRLFSALELPGGSRSARSGAVPKRVTGKERCGRCGA